MKNYTTEIPAERSIQEVERILIDHEATDIWKEYEGKQVVALNFAIRTEFGKLPIRLTANVAGVKQVLINEQRSGKIKISKRMLMSDEHPRNVAWRVLKDWVDSQMARVDAEKVKVERIFLADVYDMAKKRTLYDLLKEGQFKGLLMESQK